MQSDKTILRIPRYVVECLVELKTGGKQLSVLKIKVSQENTHFSGSPYDILSDIDVKKKL